MRSRVSRSVMNDCKKGLSLLICVSSAGLFAAQPMANDHASELVNEAGEVANAQALLARADPLTNECEMAIRHSHEVAPEVLALASWPLDTNLPAECDAMDGASNLVAEINILQVEPDSLSAGSMGQADVQGSSLPMNVPGLEALEPAPNPLGNNLVALADSSLDDIRGGFELADTNLKFSFGIERAVFVNGELVASTVLNVKDLQLAVGGGTSQVTMSSSVPGAIGVVQNGTGNGIAAQFTSNQAGTVIQNALNDQKIQNITTINATVNSAQMMRAMSVQSAIQQGLVNSLRR